MSNISEASGIPIYCAFDQLEETASLRPNPRNPNRHSGEQIALLAKIVSAQGWRAPITVSNRSGFVVRGHGRLLAAMRLGLKQVPVDYQDYMSEQEELADLVADNRLAELAEVDDAALRQIFADLQAAGCNLDLTGFDADSIDELLAEAEIMDIDDLLREIEMSEAAERPLWLTVRTSSAYRETLEEAANLLEKRGIKVERSYAK